MYFKCEVNVLKMENTESKTKNSKRIPVCNLISSPQLRFKNRKCFKLRKRNKLETLSLSKLKYSLKTTPRKPFSCTVKCIEDHHSGNISPSFSQSENLGSRASSNMLILRDRPNVKNIKSNRKDCNTKPSIVRMSFSSNIDNIGLPLKEHCAKKQSGKDVINSLKSLIMSAGHEGTPRSTGRKILEQNEFHESESSNQSVFQDKVTNMPTLKLHKEPFTKKLKAIKVSNNILNRPKCIFTVNSVDMKHSLANMYELNNSKFLMVVQPESCLYLVGIIELELLKGSVEVLGYTLNKKNVKLLIFSLQGSSHLFLKAKSSIDSKQESEEFVHKQLLSLGLSQKTLQKVLKEFKSCTFLIINRKNSHVSSTVWPTFFENHLSFSIFPPPDYLFQETRPCHIIEHRLDCLFDGSLQELGLKELTEIPEWSLIEKDIISQDFPRTVLCGGKSVGKSTLLRYLINKSLQKWDRVLVIDFDIGQCEFTVAGCVSATLVEEPVLGPNYSHLKEPLRSVFLGEIDVTKCPESYIKSCKMLINYAKQNHNTIPWLVNTMGFSRGFGVTLTCGIIQNVCPTHVVQIQSKNRKLNFPSTLNQRYVNCQNVDAFSNTKGCSEYKLYVIPSASEHQGNSSQNTNQGRSQHNSRGIGPLPARNLVMLSYLSGMLSSEISSLSQVTPYMVDMKLVELKTTNKYNLTKAQIAATMDGNLVALCRSKEEDFPNCLGFGVVRAVDYQTDTIFLITPLGTDTLNNVNCLIKGNIALPDSLYYNQGEQIIGHVPYMAHTSGRSTSQFAKRDFRTLPVTTREDKK